MDNQKFIYVTYIASTPEQVWKALLEGELTRQYWGHENVSEWKKGSQWKHVTADAKREVRVAGEVLEIVPQKRLVLSWRHTADAEAKPSQATFDIDTVGDMVRLTVTHEDLDPETFKKISNGWARVLSSLKSFLETGRPLNTLAN